jgi:hypothetical protein
MPPRWLLVLAALSLTFFKPTISHACRVIHQSPFELFAAAATVAVVEPSAMPQRHPRTGRFKEGRVTLNVVTLLKGSLGTATLRAKVDGSSCDVRFESGQAGVILLGPDGWPVGAHQGYLLQVAVWLPILEAWSMASSAEARVSLLVDAIAGAEASVAKQAASYLLEQPALLAIVDAGARARLVSRLSAPSDPPPYLKEVLVRLRETVVIASLPVSDLDLRELAAITRYEAETDPAKLAMAMKQSADRGEVVAAFERCERARGATLVRGRGMSLAEARSYLPWLKGLDPRRLASACKTGRAL